MNNIKLSAGPAAKFSRPNREAPNTMHGFAEVSNDNRYL